LYLIFHGAPVFPKSFASGKCPGSGNKMLVDVIDATLVPGGSAIIIVAEAEPAGKLLQEVGSALNYVAFS